MVVSRQLATILASQFFPRLVTIKRPQVSNKQISLRNIFRLSNFFYLPCLLAKMDNNPTDHGQILIEFSDKFIDHRLQSGQTVLPGSSLLLHSLLVNSKIQKTKGWPLFEDIFFLKPICVDRGQAIKMAYQQIINASNGLFQVNIFNADERERPVLVAKIPFQSKMPIKSDHPKPPFPTTIQSGHFYEFMRHCGYQYGPAFTSVKRVDYGIGFEHGRICAWGRCYLTEEAIKKGFDVQLDGLWQAMAFCILRETQENAGNGESNKNIIQRLLVPFSIGQLQIAEKFTLGVVPLAEMYFLVQLEGPTLGSCWIKMERSEEMLLMADNLLFRPMPDPIERPILVNSEKKVIIRSMACRLPGDITSPEAFWTLLCEGKTTDQRIPATRIPERNLLIRGEYNDGIVPVEGGHFLRGDLAAFDAHFFGLSALEAAAMDPQQRILLECVWECVEKAGASKPMAQCGFFVGFMGSEYAELAEQENALQMLGSAASTISGRLAHFFDSRGPAISIDTACSSSLVAMQLAVDAIRKGRCPRAIVGGVNLTLTAKGLVQRANGGMLSEDGRCRAFDASANGYGRADGCVAMLLEMVEDASELDEVPHWAVIEAIESGHDGRSAALTAPNGLAQQELLQRCLGQLSPEQRGLLRCWECHGTGTALGDPIEFVALAQALDQAGVPPGVLAATAKANIGHTEAASGLVGVMKAALQLQHAFVPLLPHFQRLNGEIEKGMMGKWGEEGPNWPVRIENKGKALESKTNSKLLLAGVSSFGVAGTLACSILSLDRSIRSNQLHSIRDQLRTHCSRRWQRIMPLSAKSAHSLEEMARKCLAKIEEEEGEWPLEGFCAAAANLRTHFAEYRAALIFVEDGEGKLKAEVVKKQFARIHFRLGFWSSFEPAFFHEVPSYRHAFRAILRAVNAEEEDVLAAAQNGSHPKALLQLADAFARFRMVAKFGVIQEDGEEVEEEGGEALNILRQLLWMKGTMPKEKILECLQEIEKENEVVNGHEIKQKRGGSKKAVDRIIIGPPFRSPSSDFAYLPSPLAITRLLAHAHCLGLPLRWPSIFPLPLPSSTLLSHLPLPDYPFDKTKRFWTGRDGWGAVDHPLLGNMPLADEKAEFGRQIFEGHLSMKRAPWIGQLFRHGRPLLLGIGSIVEILAAAGRAHFHRPFLSIRLEQFNPIEMPSSAADGSAWLRTEIDTEEEDGWAKVRILCGGQQICRAEIKAMDHRELARDGRKEPIGNDGIKNGPLRDSGTKFIGNNKQFSRSLGITYGQAYRVEFVQLANGNVRIGTNWAAKECEAAEYWFNPILLENALIQILTRSSHNGQQTYESFPQFVELVELFLDDAKQDEEKEKECALEWYDDEGRVDVFGNGGGNLMLRVFIRRNGQGGRTANVNGQEEMEEFDETPQKPTHSASSSSASASLVAVSAIHGLLCSALASGQLPPNWLDSSLTQLGLDSLALMALAQTLNRHFGLGQGGRRQISPAEVFMAGRARELVELVEKRVGGGGDGIVGEGKGLEKWEAKWAKNDVGKRGKKEIEEENGGEEGNWQGMDGKMAVINHEGPQKNDGIGERGEKKREGAAEANRAKNEGKSWALEDGDDGAEALECIFEVVEKSEVVANFRPDIWIRICQVDNDKVAIDINKANDGTKRGQPPRFSMAIHADAFEESEKRLREGIFEHGMEATNLHLALDAHSDFGTFPQHVPGAFSAFSASILLLARAVRVHLQQCHPSTIVRLQMDNHHQRDALAPMTAFGRTFFHNLQTEIGGQFELVNGPEYGFRRLEREKERTTKNKPKGTWLITGGTGGIGLEMARWLVDQFSPQLDCLLLLARNRPKSDAAYFWQCFSQMRRQCRVELVLCDVSNLVQMSEVFQRPEMRRLDGVVHSAGILLNAPILAMDAEAMGKVVGAKAAGALLLHSLMAQFRLEPSHFLINSSLASLHPAHGQAAYAAANALCDELIRQRRARGLAGCTLNWANWLEVGMAANRPGTNQQLHWLGLPGMPTQVGLDSFRLALRRMPVQWLCARFDWQRLQRQRRALWERFEFNGKKEKQEKEGVEKEIDEAEGRQFEQIEKTDQPAHSSPTKPVRAAEQIERLILDVLGQQLADHDGTILADATELVHLGFMELGLDSMGLYQFAHELNGRLSAAQFGVGVSVLDLFERGNAAKLAEYLGQKAVAEQSRIGRKAEGEEEGRGGRGGNIMNDKRDDDEDEKNWAEFAARHHRLDGRPLVPAAIQINTFFENMPMKMPPSVCLRNVEFQRMLWLDEWGRAKLVVEQPSSLSLMADGKGVAYSRCTIETANSAHQGEMEENVEKWMEWSSKGGASEDDSKLLDMASFYGTLASIGMTYGPAMRLVQSAKVMVASTSSGWVVHAKMANCPPSQVPMPPYWPLAEFGLQTLAVGLFHREKAHFFVPLSIGRIRWHQPSSSSQLLDNIPRAIVAIGKVKIEPGGQFAGGNVTVLAESGREVLLELDGIMARRMSKGKSAAEGKEGKGEENSDSSENMAKWLGWVSPEQDVAILAASGTFSGCASIAEFWEALVQGHQCLSTADNPSNDGAAHAPPPSLRQIVPISGICPAIEQFDPALFSPSAHLSMAEWRRLDPQIRLLAQHAYSALEQSGHIQGRSNKLRIGCFVGAEPSAPEYMVEDERETARGSLLGMHRRNQHSFCAQWLSHLLALSGPSVGVYSACSSSFSALAQARHAILSGDADVCLVGAVHLVHPSQIGHQFVVGQPLAKSAQSWPFCSQSEGILRGSACAVLVLRRAKEAIEGADPILGILKSVALTNDAGRKPSFMAPSVLGQREAIRLAMAQCEVAEEALAYWECHAAGTALGDSVELEALDGALFGGGEAGRRQSPLLIGSAKANLGHCFAASGLCSVIKLLEMMRNGLVPPQPLPAQIKHPDLLSPFSGHFHVHHGPMPAKLTSAADHHPLFVGSTSFGIGGTNGALILMEGPPGRLKGGEKEADKGKVTAPLIDAAACPFHFFPISAASQPSLRAFASKLGEYVQEMPSAGIVPIANALQSRREHHRFRAFVVASDAAGLAQGLAKIADDDHGSGIVELTESGRPTRELGLFFGPQGTQFPGMFDAERRLSFFLDAQMGHLCAQLGSSRHHDNSHSAATALFAIHQSILAFLREAGIFSQPKLLFGHSLGELSAHCAAGVFSAEDGVRLIAQRDELVEKGTRPAKMMMVRHGSGEQQSQPPPPSYPGLELCGRLSPNLSVLLGAPAAIEAATERIRAHGGSSRILAHPNRGFHSPTLMGPVLGQFRAAILGTLKLDGRRHNNNNNIDDGAAPVVLSNLDGRPLNAAAVGPDYFCQQMAQPVRLDLCLKTILRDFPRLRLLLEIGPPGILRQLLDDTAAELGIEAGRQVVEVIGTMRGRRRAQEGEEEEGPPQLLNAIGQLWQHGFPIDFDRLFGLSPWAWDAAMPGYQFNRIQLNANNHHHLIVPLGQRTVAKMSGLAKSAVAADRPAKERRQNGTKEANEDAVSEKGRCHGERGGTKEELAKIVAQVWHDCLPITTALAPRGCANANVGDTADFFEAGGNSLQAAQIVWEVERRMGGGGGMLTMDMLFEHPKMGAFVDAIWWRMNMEDDGKDEEEEEEKETEGKKEEKDVEEEMEENKDGIKNRKKDEEKNEAKEEEEKGKRKEKMKKTNEEDEEQEKNGDEDEYKAKKKEVKREVDGMKDETKEEKGEEDGDVMMALDRRLPMDADHHHSSSSSSSPLSSLFLPLFLPLRPMASPSPSPRLLQCLCIHPITGTALVYRHLSAHLPAWASVVGVQFGADDDDGEKEGAIGRMDSLTQLAQFYADKIVDRQMANQQGNAVGGMPSPPLLLLGHSLGGVLAREIALVLNRRWSGNGQLAIPTVVMFDSWAVGQQRIWPEKVAQFVTDRFAHFPPVQRERMARGAQKLAHLLRSHQFRPDPAHSPHIWLFRAARPTKLPFSDHIDHSRDCGWARLTPRLHLVQCEGADHEAILQAPCLRAHQSTLEAICRAATALH